MSKQNCLQLRCVIVQWSLSQQEKGLFGATDDTAAAATFSSTFEPSVNICTSFWCLDVTSQKACLYTLGFVVSFFIFCQRQTELRFKLTPRSGIWHCGVINHIQANLWILKTVVEFEGQEVESGYIFQRVLSLVVQKHSCKLDYQDKFCFKT